MEFLNGIFQFFYSFRADGRKYKGFWKNGKQNGEGDFFNPKNNEWKKGIWVDGKKKQMAY